MEQKADSPQLHAEADPEHASKSAASKKKKSKKTKKEPVQAAESKEVVATDPKAIDKADLLRAMLGWRMSEEEKKSKSHKFWDTQPVPKMGELFSCSPRILTAHLCLLRPLQRRPWRRQGRFRFRRLRTSRRSRIHSRAAMCGAIVI